MKITILVHDLSSNSVVRVYPIAKVLERNHKIEIVGPYFSEGIFTAYKEEFCFRATRGRRLPWFLGQIPQLIGSIDADVIYSFKPMPTSFGIGLIAKKFREIPLLLDIEDWDFQAWLTNFKGRSKLFVAYSMITSLISPKSAIYARMLEPLVKQSDQVTVVSRFLQNQFGGTRLVHGANTEFFDPALYDRQTIRSKYDISDNEKIVLFAGTPRPHKGLDDLLTAVELLGQQDVKLIIVGGRSDDPYIRTLRAQGSNKIRHLGYQPHALMPEVLTIADLVALPQKSSPITEAQIPGKIFEAMAMAKPIIVTNVSDLPEIVNNCGIVVPPEDPPTLAQALGSILNDYQKAMEMGQKARQRCQERYSWDAMEIILDEILKNVSKKLSLS